MENSPGSTELRSSISHRQDTSVPAPLRRAAERQPRHEGPRWAVNRSALPRKVKRGLPVGPPTAPPPPVPAESESEPRTPSSAQTCTRGLAVRRRWPHPGAPCARPRPSGVSAAHAHAHRGMCPPRTRTSTDDRVPRVRAHPSAARRSEAPAPAAPRMSPRDAHGNNQTREAARGCESTCVKRPEQAHPRTGRGLLAAGGGAGTRCFLGDTMF